MRVLSIDVGATSGRVMAVTLNEKKLAYEEIFRFETPLLKKDNELRWDIEKLLDSILFGIRKAFNQYSDVVSIGVDTWGVDYCWIKRDGTLFEPPFCYRDSRSKYAREKAQRIISKKELYDITGIQDMHFNTIYQLYDDFHKPNRKSFNMYKILMIPDYIAYCLTGEMRLELTNASTSGLIDHKTLEPSERILSKLKIPSYIFPDIIVPGQKYGYLKKGIVNTTNSIPVYAVCSHDTASAVLATPIDKSGAYISSGTWSLVGILLDKYCINDTSYEMNFTNELGYKSQITFLKNTMGMFLLNELRKEWKANDNPILLENIPNIVAESPLMEKFIDVDNLDFQQPGDMISKVKYYFNSRNESAPMFVGQWIRMVYECMAFKYKKIIEDLESLTKSTITSICIAGGGKNAEVLNQYVANATNKIVKTGPSEVTLLGNAIVQLISLGKIKEEEIAEIVNNSSSEKVFEPQEVELFQDRYEKYLTFTKGEKSHD